MSGRRSGEYSLNIWGNMHANSRQAVTARKTFSGIGVGELCSETVLSDETEQYRRVFILIGEMLRRCDENVVLRALYFELCSLFASKIQVNKVQRSKFKVPSS